jgi:TatD DNase family protein
MIPFIDTHAHLNLPDFDPDREEVIRRARAFGVRYVLIPGIDLPSSRISVELAQRFEGLYAAVGIHPHEAKGFTRDGLFALRELTHSPQVKAIGEVGLDFYRNISPPPEQVKAFKAQVQLAKDLGLPLVVHTRAALQEVLEILWEERDGLRGVLHCFEGDIEAATRAIKLGFYISFTAAVTFPRSQALAVAKSVPLERLLLETDSPYLAPAPYRGKRNEPSYVRFVAEFIAQARGLDLETLVAATSKATIDLFNLPPLEAG